MGATKSPFLDVGLTASHLWEECPGTHVGSGSRKDKRAKEGTMLPKFLRHAEKDSVQLSNISGCLVL